MSKQPSEPGREITVSHPDYRAPSARAEQEHAHEGLEHLSLDQRRIALHGEDGLSDEEIARATGRRIA